MNVSWVQNNIHHFSYPQFIIVFIIVNDLCSHIWQFMLNNIIANPLYLYHSKSRYNIFLSLSFLFFFVFTDTLLVQLLHSFSKASVKCCCHKSSLNMLSLSGWGLMEEECCDSGPLSLSSCLIL